MPRSEKFPPNGKRLTAKPEDVAALWRKYTQVIPPEYAIGTAKHETSFTVNEVDTEESGFVSKGIFQLSDAEADSVYHHAADLLDLEESCIVFVAVQKKRLDALNAAVMRAPKVKAPSTDIWAYLAVAHNQGTAAAVKTICTYGLDWTAYKKRNLVEVYADYVKARADKGGVKPAKFPEARRYMVKMADYGDDCLPPA